MKIIYIILFSIDLLALAMLSFWCLKLMDEKPGSITLSETIIGIFVSLLLLIFFLYRYIKITSKSDQHN
jgi:hypothetical protein